MKKYVFGGLFLALVGIGVLSCEKEEILAENNIIKSNEVSPIETANHNVNNSKSADNHIYLSGYIYENIYTHEILMEDEVDNFNNCIAHFVEVNFSTELTLTGNKKHDIKILSDNKNTLNGNLKYSVDNKVLIESKIVKGKEFITYQMPTDKAASCSYEAVRSCTADRIRSGNWFDKTICIIEGFACVAQTFASCFVDVCM